MGFGYVKNGYEAYSEKNCYEAILRLYLFLRHESIPQRVRGPEQFEDRYSSFHNGLKVLKQMTLLSEVGMNRKFNGAPRLIT